MIPLEQVMLENLIVRLGRENINELADPEMGATVAKMEGPVDWVIERMSARAQRLRYHPAMANTPTHVQQNFSSCSDFGLSNTWARLARVISNQIDYCFRKEGRGSLLPAPLKLSDLAVQQYPQSVEGERFGISPHRDQAGFINLVAVMLLYGPSSFHICKDREGSGSIEIPAAPGDLIVMRGGEFAGGTLSRPFHYVGRIDDPKGRLTFGMRQITTDPVVRERIRQVFVK